MSKTIPEVTLSADSIAIAASHIRGAMMDLAIYSAALSTSSCRVARAIGRRLGIEHLSNELDVAREILEKGDVALELTGALLKEEES